MRDQVRDFGQRKLAYSSQAERNVFTGIAYFIKNKQLSFRETQVGRGTL